MATKSILLTDLENSIHNIISVFRKYSEREGDKYKLKKCELKDLFREEMPVLMQHIQDPAAVDGLMKGLDANGDGECDFQEFMTFIAILTVSCHEFFKYDDK